MLSVRAFRGLLPLLLRKLDYLVPFVAYPFVGYQVVKMERQISCTTALCAHAEGLFHLVKAGRVLEDRDMECFTSDAWNSVPWSKMEPHLS